MEEENSQLHSQIEELKKNQEPYAETAENQKSLKEGALAEVKNLQEQNDHLKKEIEALKKTADHNAPEYQKRLQDGVMHELKKSEDKLRDLQTENEDLANQLQEEINNTKAQSDLKDGALAEVERLSRQLLQAKEDQLRAENADIQEAPVIIEAAKSLESAQDRLKANEDDLQSIGEAISTGEDAEDLLKKINAQKIAMQKIENDLQKKEKLIEELNGRQEAQEFEDYKKEKQIKSLLERNHTLASDLEYLQTEYEGLLQKNTELKRKVAHLRNELELVNQSRTVSLDRVSKKPSRNSRRLSDPDEIRFYAYERDFDGTFYRQLKNNQGLDFSELIASSMFLTDFGDRFKMLVTDS